MMLDRTAAPTPPVDASRAHQARAVNYLLGGKDNFEVDRVQTDASKIDPRLLRRMARAHLQFRRRAVRYMAEDAGVAQFVNFDNGFPHDLDLHLIAQRADPTARIVYVATDPVVAAHSRALLTGDPRGVVRLVPGEAGRTAELLADPELLDVLDLDRPVGVTLSSSLMTLSDDAAAAQLAVLRSAAAPGSHLALSQLTTDFDPDEVAVLVDELDTHGLGHPARTRAQLAALFAGWEPVAPGIGSILDWRPALRDAQADEEGAGRASEVHVMGGVARIR
jgi:hypothetical protein